MKPNFFYIFIAGISLFYSSLAQVNRTVELRIVVRNQEGDPVPFARVSIWHDWSGIDVSRPLGDWSRPADYQVETDEKGIARTTLVAKTEFKDESAGERAFGRTFNIEVYRTGYSRGEDTISFKKGEAIPDRLIRTITIEGSEPTKQKHDEMTVNIRVVRKDTNEAVEGAKVVVYLNTPFLRKAFPSMSDRNGDAKIITDGFTDFEIVATKDNFKDARQTIVLKKLEKITGPYTLSLEKNPGTEVTITVSDQENNLPIGDASITLDGVTSIAYHNATTDNQGRATFFVPEAGKYTVRISQEYYEEFAGEIQLQKGEDATTFTYSLKAKPKKVKGSDAIEIMVFTDEDGQKTPLPKALVSVEKTSIETDDEGRANISGSFDDDIDVTVSLRGYQSQSKRVRIQRIARYSGGTAKATFILKPEESDETLPLKLAVEVLDSKTQKAIEGASVFLRSNQNLVGEGTTNTEGETSIIINDSDMTPLKTIREGIEADVYHKKYHKKLTTITKDLLVPSHKVRRISVFLEKDPNAAKDAVEELYKKVVAWNNDANKAANAGRLLTKLKELASKADESAQKHLDEIDKSREAFGFGVAPGISRVGTSCQKAKRITDRMAAIVESVKDLEKKLKEELDNAIKLAKTCQSATDAGLIKDGYNKAIGIVGSIGAFEKIATQAQDQVLTFAKDMEGLKPIIAAVENKIAELKKEAKAIEKTVSEAEAIIKNATLLGKTLVSRRDALIKDLDFLKKDYDIDSPDIPIAIKKRVDEIEGILGSRNNDMFFLMGSKPDESIHKAITAHASNISSYVADAEKTLAGYKKIICDIKPLDAQVSSLGAVMTGATIELTAAADVVNLAKKCEGLEECTPILEDVRNQLEQGVIERASELIADARDKGCNVTEAEKELDYFKTIRDAIEVLKRYEALCKFQEALDFAEKFPTSIKERPLMADAIAKTRAGLLAQKDTMNALSRAANANSDEKARILADAEKIAQFYPCLLAEVNKVKGQQKDEPRKDDEPSLNWSGVFTRKLSSGLSTLTVNAQGSSLSASEKWTDGNNSGTSTISNCKVSGNKAKCDWTGTYNDPDKSASRKGTLEFTLSEDDKIAATYFEDEPTFNWRVTPYTSAIRKGAVWPGVFKRQK